MILLKQPQRGQRPGGFVAMNAGVKGKCGLGIADGGMKPTHDEGRSN